MLECYSWLEDALHHKDSLEMSIDRMSGRRSDALVPHAAYCIRLQQVLEESTSEVLPKLMYCDSNTFFFVSKVIITVGICNDRDACNHTLLTGRLLGHDINTTLRR